jgi:hypothetical protein
VSVSRSRIDALVKELDLDLSVGICHACLSFVSLAIDGGDPREIARWTRHMTPTLWMEGLAEPVFAAVLDARDSGVADADSALVDLERRGGASPIARAIVRRLAEKLSWRIRAELHVEALARPRLPLAPPELN